MTWKAPKVGDVPVGALMPSAVGAKPPAAQAAETEGGKEAQAMRFCQFTEAAPDDPSISVNPSLVRAVRQHANRTEIIFDANHSIIVTEAPESVARSLEHGLQGR